MSRVKNGKTGGVIGAVMSLAVFAARIALAADTWYVDAGFYDASGDGKSEATAFGTIQEAIDAAAAGDTIKVLPGVYDKGYTVDTASGGANNNRVLITKNLTIESTGGKEKTHIVGAYDPDSTSGLGDGAVRCVAVNKGVTAVKLVGFTLRDGATRQSDGSDSYAVKGGAFMGLNEKMAGNVIVDCVISNSVATRAGGVMYATMVRSAITDCNVVNNGSKSTTANSAAARNVALYNCVIAGNAARSGYKTDAAAIDYTTADIVNCTFVNNGGVAIGASGKTNFAPKNCYIAGNGSDTISSYIQLDESSVSAVNGLVMAPALGDYRPVAGGALVGAGSTDALSAIPEEYRGYDFLGNARTTDGKVTIGAIEGAVTPLTAETVILKRGMTVDGAQLNVSGQWLYSDVYPVQWRFTAPAIDERALFAYDCTNTVEGVSTMLRRFPAMDDSFVYTPATNGVTTITPLYGRMWYVDPVNGVDDKEGGYGTLDMPYRTLTYAATNTTSAGQIVYAKAGRYAEGGCKAGGHNTRLYCYRNVRVVALEGPEKTFIVGESDPDTVDDEASVGCGTNAVRCVTVNGGVNACVQGFTLTDGYTSMYWKDGKDSGTNFSEGGAYYGSDKLGGLYDCVVTNCYGSRGGAVWQGQHRRNVFVDCGVTPGGQGLARSTQLISCVIKNPNLNGDVSQVGTFGEGAELYGCTFDGVSARCNPSKSTICNSVINGSSFNDANTDSGYSFSGNLIRSAINKSAPDGSIKD